MPDGASHPGEDGDIPGGAVGDAQGGFFPGNASDETAAQGDGEVVLRVAEEGGALQQGFFFHRPAEPVQGSAGRPVLRRGEQSAFGGIISVQNDQILSQRGIQG